MEQPTFSTPDFGSSPVEYFRNVKIELSKVEWPTKDKIFRATILVFAVSVVVGSFLGGLDYMFTSLFQAIIN